MNHPTEIIVEHPRHVAHLSARASMKDANYIRGIEIMVSALAEHGPHVRLLVDLASCYYMISDFPNYHQLTVLALKEFRQVKAKLSESSLVSSSLGLGKLLEELGMISQALFVLSSVKIGKLSKPNNHKLLAQQLRLYSFVGHRKKLTELYSICESAGFRDLNTEIDLQLALMHVDISLVGIEAAQSRVKGLINRKIPREDDRRLLFFDLAFEALRRSEAASVNRDLLQKFSYGDCDEFEQVVWDILLYDLGEKPNKPLDLQRSEGLSPLSSLRVLHLLSQRSMSPDFSHEARSKFMLLANALDSVSRRWILESWNHNLAEVPTITMSDNDLLVQGKTLNLERQPLALSLIRLFRKTRIQSTDLVIRSLYGLESSESTYNRLKVLVSKLNRNLEVLSGILRPISLNKSEVKFQLEILEN